MSDLFKRLIQSRFVRRWARNLSYQDRSDLSLQLLRTLNAGLDSRSHFLYWKTIFDGRGIGLKRYPLLPSDTYARAFGFYRILGDLKEVCGDITECGVDRGRSLAYIVYAVSFFKMDKVVYAFDSFKGFPLPTLHDLGVEVKELGTPLGHYKDTSSDMILTIFDQDRNNKASLLRKHDVCVELISGFFENTLPNKLPPQIALLHVDCDLYESTKVVLERCLPRMSPGGIVIFDEYDDENWPGEKKAADEVRAVWGLDISYFDAVGRYGIRMPGFRG